MNVADNVVCARDATGVELQWPLLVPRVIGVFMSSVTLVLLFQRHEFTTPNLGLAILLLLDLPWLLDMLGLPPMRSEARLGFPLLAAWSALVIGGVWTLGLWYPVPIDFTPFVLVMLLGEMTSTAGARFGSVLLAVTVAGMAYSTTVQHNAGNAIWIFAFVIGWLAGLAFRHQTKTASELIDAQTQLAAQAKEEERHHLAREVHDLIAHSLAVTMLHLSGARLALAAGETEEAMAALADAEGAGRSAMAEIHRTMGLLGNGAEAATPPTPCAADLPDLVDGFRRAGLVVDLVVNGDLRDVPHAPGLTAYRLVQESLSNAVKHAPGAPVVLDVLVDDGVVIIRAVNTVVASPLPGPSGGNGLRGMTERVALLGGTVVTGNGDGTWKVDAQIPWSDPQ